MEETSKDVVKIKASHILAMAIGIILAVAGFSFFIGGSSLILNPYMLTMVASFILILISGYYVHSKKDGLDGMCCMMVGMTFSTVAGLAAGTFTAIVTSDFLVGSIAGTFAGLVFGYGFGKIGDNPLSRMEGVMAAPMGGMMGSMIGIMMFPFNLSIFVKFFFFIIVLLLFEIMNVVKKQTGTKFPGDIIWGFGLVVLIGFYITFTMSFGTPGIVNNANSFVLPSVKAADAASIEGTKTVLNGGVQEVTLTAKSSAYDPNTIIAQKGIPLKINFKAEDGAGCNRALVFPDFKISKVLQPGGSDIVQFTPENAGTYQFRCSMGMFRGKLVVV